MSIPREKEIELLNKIGVSLPKPTRAVVDFSSASIEWEDLANYAAEAKCPSCSSSFVVNKETGERTPCAKCGASLKITFEGIEIEAHVSVSVELTAADKKYLEWKADQLPAASVANGAAE